MAIVNRIWQVSDSAPSHLIFDNSSKNSINSSTPLKLKEGYELAIKSIDINGKKVFVELYKNEAMVDSAVIITSYDDAIRTSDASVWKNIGVALYDLGKYIECIKAYDKAIEIDAQDFVAWNNKGNALNHLGKYDEAVKAYDMAIGIDPQDAVVWDNKGNALDGWGKYDEAIKSYNRAGKTNEIYNNSMVQKGNDHYDQGKYAAAVKYYDAAIKQDPRRRIRLV